MAQPVDFQEIKTAHEAKNPPFPARGRLVFNGGLTKKAKNLRTKNYSKILTAKNFASNLLF
jgi:hypothetical protein